jgi:hypothetical protein
VVINISASHNVKDIEPLYAMLEEFKDGVFTSTKYCSRVKAFSIQHAVVFANIPPDKSKLKTDRFRITHLLKLKERYEAWRSTCAAEGDPTQMDESDC